MYPGFDGLMTLSHREGVDKRLQALARKYGVRSNRRINRHRNLRWGPRPGRLPGYPRASDPHNHEIPTRSTTHPTIGGKPSYPQREDEVCRAVRWAVLHGIGGLWVRR